MTKKEDAICPSCHHDKSHSVEQHTWTLVVCSVCGKHLRTTSTDEQVHNFIQEWRKGNHIRLN